MEFDKDWEEACPTREEAEEKLRTKAHYDEKLLRWVTGKAYHEGRVFYREVLVKEEDLS
jgi:hypothetical protein